MKKTKTKRTDAEKAAILADAKALGIAEAARKHGVTESSIYLWRKNAAPKKPQFTSHVVIPVADSGKMLLFFGTPKQLAEAARGLL